MPNVLITGGSGYLGGSLLAFLKHSRDALPSGDIFALVRTDEQADSVRAHYDAAPLVMDLKDEAIITDTLLKKKISIIFYLIDAVKCDVQLSLIKGLARVQEQIGVQTHFLHTSGAKGFSSHTGFPVDPALADDDDALFDTVRKLRSDYKPMQTLTETNYTIIECAEAAGVRAYIFVPCIVYGKGDGFGNPISIQTTAIARAAKAARRVHRVDKGRPVRIYIDDFMHHDLEEMLSSARYGVDIGSNRNGFYLASSGSLAWDDIYSAMAKPLAVRGIVEDDAVHDATDEDLQTMAEGLGCPKPFVAVSLGGLSTFAANHGKLIGWTPHYTAKHMLESMDAEVELILQRI